MYVPCTWHHTSWCHSLFTSIVPSYITFTQSGFKKKTSKNLQISANSHYQPWQSSEFLQISTVATWHSSHTQLPTQQPKSCPTLCDPMDCCPPGSSVHGILQARILEWVAIPFSRGSSRPRDWTQVSSTAGRFLNFWVMTTARVTF